MPKITDDDDVNLDDLDTEVVVQNDDDPDTEDEDLPDGDESDDERDSDGPSEDDDESGRDGEVDQAAASQRDREDRQQSERRRERSGGRENERIRVLAEQNAALQRRFDEYVARQQQQTQPRESEAERNSRRALMSETERMAEDLKASEQRTQQLLQQTTFTVQDSADKSIFEAKAVHDPLYKRWAPKVEAEKARLAQQGANVSREAILRYMIGDAALQSRGSKTNSTEKALGRRRVERQRVRPNDTRNDATQSRRGGGRSLEDRLADVPL